MLVLSEPFLQCHGTARARSRGPDGRINRCVRCNVNSFMLTYPASGPLREGSRFCAFHRRDAGTEYEFNSDDDDERPLVQQPAQQPPAAPPVPEPPPAAAPAHPSSPATGVKRTVEEMEAGRETHTPTLDDMTPLRVKFEKLDQDGDFTQMYHMLDHSAAVRDFLVNHIKMTRRVRKWAIEERPLFAPCLPLVQ
jgi:hypothetical protein